MTEIWHRSVYVEIGPEGGQGLRVGTGLDGQLGLHIEFDVKMTRSSSPNTAKITIWNAGDEAVSAIQGKSKLVRLFAGHLGFGRQGIARMLFQGSPIRDGVTDESQPPDTRLVIEASDGGRQYRQGRVNRSFATNSSAQQVFDEIANAMGLALGRIQLDQSYTLPKGYVACGPARKVLQDLVTSMGRRWFIRDGALYVLELDDDSGESAIVFSTDAGNLIGVPKPKDRGVEITALIAPDMRPSRAFTVESEKVSGDFIATDVRFRGSSGHTNPFYVTIVGVPREGAAGG